MDLHIEGGREGERESARSREKERERGTERPACALLAGEKSTALSGVSVPVERGKGADATAYWATSAQGGVTRRGVVLTYLLSLVIGSQ